MPRIQVVPESMRTEATLGGIALVGFTIHLVSFLPLRAGIENSV